MSPEAEAIETAAERSRRWIEASDAAMARHARLSAAGLLGAQMSVPARQRRSERQERPVEQRQEHAVRAVDLETNGLYELYDGIERLKKHLAARATARGVAASRRPEPETRTNQPTAQRRALTETAIEIYATTTAAGRDIASEAFRVVPVVEHMERRGQLGEAERRAAERFYRDFVLGHRVAGITAKYGDRAGTGGTPLAQQARNVELSPEELRSHFHGRFIAACQAINHWPTTEWMVRIVCEQLLAAEAKPPTLADAGRQYMSYRDAKQAQAAGATLLKTGLQRLVRFYGLER